MANYLKKAVFGVSVVFILSLVGMFAAYLFRLVLSRNLSPEQFGLFYSVLSLVITFHLFKDVGLKYSLVKFIPEFLVKKDYEGINKAISTTLSFWTATSLILSLAVSIFAKFFADHYFEHPDAVVIIYLLAISYFWVADYIIAYVLQGFQKMGLFASVDALRATLFLTIALIGFKLYPENVLVPAAAYAITPFVLTAIFVPLFKSKVFPSARLRFSIDWAFLKRMVYFGLPVTVTSFCYTLFQQASILILTYFGTLKEVGLLNIALPTAALLIGMSSSLLNVIFPLSSELWSRGLTGQLKEGIRLLYKYSFMAVLPASLVLMAFSELIIRLLFGAEYAGAAPALMVLSLGTVFWVISNINFTILAGIGKSKEPMNAMIAILVMTLIANFVLIPKYRLLGAVIAMVIGYFLSLILSLVMLRRHIKVKIPIAMWALNLLVGGAFLATMWFTKNSLALSNVYVEAIVTLIAGCSVYGILLLIFKMTSFKEVKSHIKRALKRQG